MLKNKEEFFFIGFFVTNRYREMYNLNIKQTNKTKMKNTLASYMLQIKKSYKTNQVKK